MPSPSTRNKPKKQEEVEKRLKRWRGKCPQKVQERIARAKQEKMYVVKQTLSTKKCKFVVSGSTGNIYDVKIGKLPCCTCPDYKKREDACKHTLFVLLKIIGLDIDDELLYQRAYMTEELNVMFQRMVSNKKKASKYYLKGEDDELDEVVHGMSEINIEENGHYQYANIRKYTGQPSVRDTSTYRPFHTGYNY